MSPKLCLLWRAFVAAILVLGFYILGFGIGGGLLYLGYRLSMAHNEYARPLFYIDMYLSLVILVFLVPFPIRFQAPGPRLQPDEQPLFFEVVKRAADMVGN